MANEKISAMTDATEFFGTDFFPIVQAGNNLKCTRNIFLTAATGEELAMSGGGSAIGVTSGGTVFVSLNSGQVVTFDLGTDAKFEIIFNGSTIFRVTEFGDVFIEVEPGEVFHVQCGGAEIAMDETGFIGLTTAGSQSVFASYFTPNPGDWTTTPPDNLAAAFDRLVAWVAFLAGPIGDV